MGKIPLRGRVGAEDALGMVIEGILRCEIATATVFRIGKLRYLRVFSAALFMRRRYALPWAGGERMEVGQVRGEEFRQSRK